MAGLLYTLSEEDAYRGVQVVTVPGLSAVLSGSAVLGAPVGHDFCVISLSDLLTPWTKIEQRLKAAAAADFVIVLYNPVSRHSTSGHARSSRRRSRKIGYVRTSETLAATDRRAGSSC